MTDETWMADASCRHSSPDLFFPGEDQAAMNEAKRICAACPVKQPCLDYALDNIIKHGVWGGLSEKQRRAIRKTRKTVEA